MKENKPEFLKPNPWRIILLFCILFLVFEAIFFASFQGGIYGKLWPLEYTFYIYTPTLVGVNILFCILTITQTKYEVTKNKLVHYKMGKVTEYYWTDIVYVDEKFSEKKKMMRFYTKEGRECFLTFDKNRVIYYMALEKCRLMDEEEFRRRYPNIKL